VFTMFQTGSEMKAFEGISALGAMN
jgi:hypothetical protein